MASKITLQIAGHQKTWVNAVQKRVAITSVVLSEMKNVRMMGLGRLLTDMIQTLRVQETDSMAKYRWNIVWKNVISNACYYLAPPATFAAYGIQAAAQGNGGINTSRAFASLSIIALVVTPFTQLIQVVPQTAAGLGSFDRIQQFLLSNPRRDQRQPLQRSDGSTGTRSQRSAGTNTSEDCHYETGGVAPNLAISLENVDLRPTPEADVVLSNISFDIPRGSIAMVIGSVASGKSTLLKSILGEAVQEKGTISVADRRIAYCGQTPWLPNTTIRKAITRPVGEDKVDERWYENCVRACALDRDFDALPDRDQTSIGSGTTTLSGGQKHRVALARAAYARARIVALDSVLSALDNDTKNTVSEALFGQDGLFRQIGSTVIFVTHTGE
jgi:ATP-binding cassette, subfamily C (CFTR/MRP), member 1